MRKLIIAAALSFAMSCFGTARADSLGSSDDEGFAIGSGPGNSWVGWVVYNVGSTKYNYGNKPASDSNYSSDPAKQYSDYYRPTDYQFNIVDPSGGQSTQHFETLPATVTPYGGLPVASTETLFNSNSQMEIHLPSEFTYVGGYSELISLPFAVGDWNGSVVTGSPTFVLQMQAYNTYGDQLYNEDVEFVTASQTWVGRGSRGPTFVNGSPGGTFCSRWEADSPLTSPEIPEPLTIAGVCLGVVALGRYFRRHPMTTK